MDFYALPADQQSDIQRRIAKGHGELITIAYDDLEEVIAQGDDARSTGVLPEVQYNKVPKTRTVYVGKLTLGQTGTVVARLAALFVRGKDLQEAVGSKNPLLFINAVDPRNLAILLGRIVNMPAKWVDENYELDWVVEVVAAFLKHNDFLGVYEKVKTLLAKYGLTTDKVQALVSGQEPAR